MKRSFALFFLVLIAACTGLDGFGGPPQISRFAEAQIAPVRAENMQPDRCYALSSRTEDTATRILTGADMVAEDMLDTDPQSFWFEALCPDALTPDLIASLQRALIARELLDGPADGQLTAATRAAVRAFQADDSVETSVLSLAAAKRLGLVPYDRDELA